MFIEVDIFKGELFIPFPDSSDSCIDQTTLDWFVDNYEAKILREILGRKLYNELVAQNTPGPLAGIWKTLVDGGEYEVDGEKYYFKGLKYILACYLYFYMTREDAIETTTNGGKVVEYENAKNVSLEAKRINNWNNATRLLKSTECHLKNRRYYGTIDSSDEETLEFFLSNNSEFDNIEYCVNFYEGGLIYAS